jgi:hypothetical protein
VGSFWSKWLAFFRPVAGWAQRLREAKAGRNVWEVPGKPEKSKLVPFPIEWMPHRLELTEEDDEAAHIRGFVFLPGTCVDTGKEAAVGDVVSCCRCGVPLHPLASHMIGGMDPPYCRRCRWVIKLVL